MLDPKKDYKITQLDHHKISQLKKTFDIMNTRQPIRYADLLDFYRNDKERFRSHVKPPCAPHGSRRNLVGLFENRSLNDKLLRIFRFRGLAKYCTWNSLTVFYELSYLVPQELEQKLDHLAIFWEELSLLTESSDEIYCDEDTSSKLSGLWPLKCESDMGKLRTLENSRHFFALVTDSDIRQSIVNKIATLNYRVPTLPLVISESSALRQLATLLEKNLSAMGERSFLKHGELGWKGRRANEYQYWQCFLAAARAQCNGSHETIINDLRRIFEAVEPVSPPRISAAALQETSRFRRVSAYPHGIWSSAVILALLFDNKMLSTGPSTCVAQPELPIILLLQDFLHSFFKVNSLKSQFQNKPSKASWQNKKVVQYIPFKLDVSLKENNADDILWGILHDVVIEDTTEGDVRRRGKLAVATPVQSVYTSISNPRNDELMTRGSSVQIIEAGQINHGSTSATSDKSHGSETASSIYEDWAMDQGTTVPSTSLSGNTGTEADVWGYLSIVKEALLSVESHQPGELEALKILISENGQSQPEKRDPMITTRRRINAEEINVNSQQYVTSKQELNPNIKRLSDDDTLYGEERDPMITTDDDTLCGEEMDSMISTGDDKLYGEEFDQGPLQSLQVVKLNNGQEKYAMKPLENHEARPRAVSYLGTKVRPIGKKNLWDRVFAFPRK